MHRLSKVENKGIDVACTDERREGEDAGLAERRFEPQAVSSETAKNSAAKINAMVNCNGLAVGIASS